MKYRKLRIAWSVTWGIVCLLLVLLWERSYHYRYIVVGKTNSQLLNVGTLGGKFRILLCPTKHADLTELNGTFTFLCREYHKDEWEIPPGAVGFGWFHNNLADEIFIPHWFTLLTSALFAVAPWIKWSRRFSLRTLLIAMTVSAIGLGLVVYVMRS